MTVFSEKIFLPPAYDPRKARIIFRSHVNEVILFLMFVNRMLLKRFEK
jgi:hypothetical protein